MHRRLVTCVVASAWLGCRASSSVFPVLLKHIQYHCFFIPYSKVYKSLYFTVKFRCNTARILIVAAAAHAYLPASRPGDLLLTWPCPIDYETFIITHKGSRCRCVWYLPVGCDGCLMCLNSTRHPKFYPHFPCPDSESQPTGILIFTSLQGSLKHY